MKKIKKLFFILVLLINTMFSYISIASSAWETITQQDMRVGATDGGGGGKLDIGGGSDVSFKDNFLKTGMSYVLGVVFIVAIAIFIYIGFELATAEGKQEKFTKGLKGLAYAGVGLAIIPLSYIIVKIATGFNF